MGLFKREARAATWSRQVNSILREQLYRRRLMRRAQGLPLHIQSQCNG